MNLLKKMQDETGSKSLINLVVPVEAWLAKAMHQNLTFSIQSQPTSSFVLSCSGFGSPHNTAGRITAAKLDIRLTALSA